MRTQQPFSRCCEPNAVVAPSRNIKNLQTVWSEETTSPPPLTPKFSKKHELDFHNSQNFELIQYFKKKLHASLEEKLSLPQNPALLGLLGNSQSHSSIQGVTLLLRAQLTFNDEFDPFYD